MKYLIIIALIGFQPALAGWPKIAGPVVSFESSVKIQGEDECANFTGNWVGTCVDQDGISKEDKVNLVQEGCFLIKGEGIAIVVAGMKTKAIADVLGLMSISKNYNWIKDKKVLLEINVGLLTGLENNNEPQSWLIRTEVNLENGKLVTKSSGKNAGKDYSLTCTYDKKS